MQDWVDTYEAIQNKIIDASVDVRTIHYWDHVKSAVWYEFKDTDYESYCYDVVNRIMDDEMYGRISGHVLLDLIKIGLPYYSAVRN